MIENDRRPLDEQELHEMLKGVMSHDHVMTRLVLGREMGAIDDFDSFEDCCTKPYELINWMGNLMTLAGAFLYCKFNQWRENTGTYGEDSQIPNVLYLKRLFSGIQETAAYFDQPSSGLRVLRVLDGLYDNFDMNFFVIKYLIINSQIEAGFNFQDDDEDRRGLTRLLGFPHEESLILACTTKRFKNKGSNLAEAFNYISLCRNDPRLKNTFDTKKYKISKIKCTLEKVLYAMGFMRRIRLEIDGEGIVNFVEKTKDGELFVPSYGVVRAFETEKGNCKGVYKSGMDLPVNFTVGFYLLEKVEYITQPKTTNSALRLSYQLFDESESVRVYFTEKGEFEPEECNFAIAPKSPSAAECFKRISGYLPGTRNSSSFFRGMLTAHYRYHNVLAPSIVDAIDGEGDAKCRILSTFVRDDENTFREALEPMFRAMENTLGENFPSKWKEKIDKLCEILSRDEFISRRVVDWDTLMARILIYEGPSEIVKTAILHDKTYHLTKDKQQIENICDHIIAGLEMRYIDDIFDANTVSQLQKDSYNVFKPNIEKLKSMFPGEHVAKIECKALAQSYIDTIVKTLTKIDKNDFGGVNNRFAENSIQDTLEILRTHDKKSPAAKKAFLRTIRAFLCFYAGLLKSCRARLSYEFEKSSTILSPTETEKRQLKIEEDFFSGVAERAKELTLLFSQPDAVKLAVLELWNFACMRPEDERYYNAILARPPINVKKLANIFTVVDKNIIFKTESGEDIDFEQATEHGMAVGCLEKIIGFLTGGEDYIQQCQERNQDKSNYTGYKEYAKKVIYPQIVTFAKHREDCDANDCLIMDHSGAFAGWHDGEVQILTEFKYSINHAYYAIPNLNRIETEWWVDPLLFSCFKFDEELRNADSCVNKVS